MNINKTALQNENFNMSYLKKIVYPDTTNRIHCHPYHELVIIEKGFVRYTTNNEIVEVKAPCVVFMPAYTIHNPFVQQTEIYERHKIEFDFGFTDNYFKDTKSLGVLVEKPYIKMISEYDSDEINRLAKSLFNFKNKNPFTKTDGMFEAMYLCLILQKCGEAVSIEAVTDENYISKVTDMIRKNFNRHLTIEIIADSFFVSKGKLIYDFKNYCNMNVLEYITMTRCDFAKEYLKKGLSVSETSDKCGFSSPSYFIKVFTRITGTTPLKFRQKHCKEKS
ncbi:MAG: helix-turn-helix transcriptional regulator [Clostridia bacterium]|nr:helix-turn-helix transcriptional regulator [Clostridia bacterium]